ncbi:uncharacterized protein BT62DRAFT_938617 [Guyanagaster necrorhizus]|uniref:Transmembrane protein n=1 Tax=Guyanagaster necrorhizus TaxID=856835 RepID=A0A9P7VF70_9AGAR|nr:uncharacterized protein BT62DRAFT_938617 [Guyanagaster necrorhizus MCA 3950]KAG7439828.1 hypothetical protein BT62DRAFT_938617 [Guyanagaster necrorhizus MCA 3950]
MPSFNTILSYAALGLAAFASVQAAPAPMLETSLAVRTLDVRCGCTPLPQLVNNLITDLAVVLEPVQYVTSGNCTAEILKPILEDAINILGTALTDVQALVGLTTDVVLSTGSGVLSVVDLCGLLTILINLISGVVALVIKLVAVVDKEVVCNLLGQIVILLCKILAVVVGLVDSVLVLLVTLLNNVVLPLILNLSLGVVLNDVCGILGLVI